MKKIIRVIPVAILCCFLWTTGVFAQPFSGGTYSSCGYGSNCTSASGGETTVQLPSGLDVAINLYNGEHIPKTGLLILVTPLNGQGTSFASAQFVIDGQPVHVGTPDEEGTVTWRWHPDQHVGAHVTIAITVTGQAGQTVTKTYTVIIVATAPGPTVGVGSRTPRVSSMLPVSVLHAFQQTPHIIVYTVPYLLFLLLAAGVAISAWGTWHEVSATRKLKNELAQLERIAVSRRNFINLASHYLRTPVTLVRGGLEFLPKNVVAANKPLEQVTASLHIQVEQLIQDQETADTAPRPAAYTSLRTHTHPYFWLPASICIALVCLFDYLAEQADTLSVRSVTLYTQMVTGVLVVAVSYFALRWRQLSNQDRQLTADRLSLADKSLAAREQFLHDASQTLSKLLAELKTGIVKLSDSSGKAYMLDGLHRIEHVVQTFAIADRIRGVRSDKPYKSVDIAQLLSRSLKQLQKVVKEKDIRIEQDIVASSQTPEPALLQLVCQHILDNAVTYAPAQSVVTIKAVSTKQGTTIRITDHGPGIPKEEQQALFTPFEKAEGAKTFNHEGMGFSLYLDMLIMLYLRGRISIDSRPGMTTATILFENRNR